MLSLVIFICGGFAAALIDFKKHIIPNRLNASMALSLLIFAPNGTHALINGLLAMSLLAIPCLFTRGSIGMGDIKFQFSVGILLTTKELEALLYALETALFLAAFYLIFQRIVRKVKERNLAFGPFLYIGALAIYFY